MSSMNESNMSPDDNNYNINNNMSENLNASEPVKLDWHDLTPEQHSYLLEVPITSEEEWKVIPFDIQIKMLHKAEFGSKYQNYLADRFNSDTPQEKHHNRKSMLETKTLHLEKDKHFKALPASYKIAQILAEYKGISLQDELIGVSDFKPIKFNNFTGELEVYREVGEPDDHLTIFEQKYGYDPGEKRLKRVLNHEAMKNAYYPPIYELVKALAQLGGQEFHELFDHNSPKQKIIHNYYNDMVSEFKFYNGKPDTKFEEIFEVTTESKDDKPPGSLEEFFKNAFHINDSLSLLYMKNCIIAAVARILQPGCKSDEILILRSHEQGFRKSTSIKALFGNEFTTELQGDTLTDKDSIANFYSSWVTEIAEIDRITCTKDAAITKAFFTTLNDTYRVPYLQRPATRQRHWIVIGTTNSETLFLDIDNRRYNVVEIPEPIDIDYIKKWRKIALALATIDYIGGVQWWIDENSEEGKERKRRNKDYQVSDDIMDRIEWDKLDIFHSSAIAFKLGLDLNNKTIQMRIGREASQRGFIRKRIKFPVGNDKSILKDEKLQIYVYGKPEALDHSGNYFIVKCEGYLDIKKKCYAK